MKTKSKRKPAFLTVGELKQQLKKVHPNSLVRLHVPIGEDDFNPKRVLGVYQASYDTICARDNGDDLAFYCGSIVHSGDVVIVADARSIIQGPRPKWNKNTQNWYWPKADKKILSALRKSAAEDQKATDAICKELDAYTIDHPLPDNSYLCNPDVDF